jgi:tetraacyldisaccharide 4'-kinase
VSASSAGKRSRGLARLALRAVSWPYAAASRLRRRAYQGGLLARTVLPRPVLSVGNLTAGGTGKTPVVEWLVRDLAARGRRPAILSRGYAGADGTNDEYRVLHANLPDVLHLQGPDRAARGTEAITRGADCLVLDDGFQHLRLARDADLVLVDALNPFGTAPGRTPTLLREGPRALAAADAVILTRCDLTDPAALAALHARLEAAAPGVLRAEVDFAPTALERADGSREGPAALAGRAVFAFCAIGNPDAFVMALAALGARVCGTLFFRDHHWYTAGDLERVAAAARAAGAESVVATQKDCVKLTAGDRARLDAAALRIGTRFRAGEAAVREVVGRALAAHAMGGGET